jgi:hypothetical protein
MSADEIANLLARLEIPVYDTARRNYNSTVRLISGQPSRALIAKNCKAVAIQATFLDDKLCIHLVRLAHRLKNKGVWLEVDHYKREIINYWTSMTDEFKEGLMSSNDQKNTTISNIMVEIQSEMDIYTSRWDQTLYRHTPKETHTARPIPDKGHKTTPERKYIEWFTEHGNSSVKHAYNPKNPIAWTDPHETLHLVHYIHANSNDVVTEQFLESNWKALNTGGFRYLQKLDNKEMFMHIHKPTWAK